jgi:multiple sugar transport system permease protein
MEIIKSTGKKRLGRMEYQKRIFAYAAILPVIVIFFFLRILPILSNFLYSFFDSTVVNPTETFIGFANYLDLFTDELFTRSLVNTTLFALFVTVFSVVIALAVALLLSEKTRMGMFMEAVYFLPVITPMVPVAVVWKWIYDPTYGLLNYFLSFFGVKPIGWLVYPDLAMYAIIIMSVWKVIGYNMIIFLVGIREIPDSYIEASMIDGANRFQSFRYIVLPLLKPILLFVTVISTINAYNVFTQVFIMTSGPQGAPGNAVRTLVFDIYENAFRYFKTGYAASEAVMLFLIILVLTMSQLSVGGKKK